MPKNVIRTSKRAKAGIAGVLALIAAGTYQAITVRGQPVPPAVIMAAELLVKSWEGLELVAYWDAHGKVWTVCYGETLGVKKGDRFTAEQCRAMLIKRLTEDYYLPMAACAGGFTKAPIPVQAAMLSGGYNFGVGFRGSTTRPGKGWCGSTAAEKIRQGRFYDACIAQTTWNKAGGVVLEGLVLRREMGDAARLGEAELCVSGLDAPPPIPLKLTVTGGPPS